MNLPRISNIIAVLGLVLVSAWWLSKPVHAIQGTGFYCSKNAIFDTSPPGGTTTPNGYARVITADGSTNQIYICSYVISIGTQPGNAGLVYGKGPQCGANPTPVTPLWQLAANELFLDNSPGWRGILVPSGNDVCINTYSSSAKPVQAQIFYEVAP